VLTTTGTLDRDTATGGRQFYDVTLIARDKGMPALSVDRTLRVEIIDVNDNAPVITETIYFASSLAEGAPAGKFIIQYFAQVHSPQTVSGTNITYVVTLAFITPCIFDETLSMMSCYVLE